MAAPGVVTIIETPTCYMVEQRPNIPGKLAYPGLCRLYGGHVEAGESAVNALVRELYEELGATLVVPPQWLWRGTVQSQNTFGRPVERHVDLFHVFAGTMVGPWESVVSLVPIPKTQSAVTAHRERLTPFCKAALVYHMAGRAWAEFSPMG